MTGVFAVHGGSDCSGTCLNGTAMELFVNYADFDSKNANQTAMLNVIYRPLLSRSKFDLFKPFFHFPFLVFVCFCFCFDYL